MQSERSQTENRLFTKADKDKNPSGKFIDFDSVRLSSGVSSDITNLKTVNLNKSDKSIWKQKQFERRIRINF